MSAKTVESQIELPARLMPTRVTYGSKTWILQARNYGVLALDDDHFRLVCTSCITGLHVRASKYIFTNMMDASFWIDLANGWVACNKCSRYSQGTPEEDDLWVECMRSRLHLLPTRLCRPPAVQEYTLDMMKFAAAEQVWAEQYDRAAEERFHPLLETRYWHSVRRLRRLERMVLRGRRMLKRSTGPERGRTLKRSIGPERECGRTE